MVRYVPERTGDEATNRNLEALRRAIRALSESVFGTRFVVVRNVALSTTAADIPHGLGSVPAGWIVVRRDGPASVYESGTFGASSIGLVATADVNVTLIIW